MNTSISSKRFNEKTIAELLNGMAFPSLIVDSKGIIVKCNKSFVKIIGKNAEGRSVSPVLGITPSDLDELSEYFYHVSEINFDIHPVKLKRKKYFLFLGSKTGKQFSKSESQIKGLVHDINNILASVINSVTLLKRQYINEQKVVNLLDNIARNSKNAADIIDEGLSAGPYFWEKENVVDVVSIIKDAVNTAESSAGENAVINLTGNLKPAYVKSIRTNLYRAILNLLYNASETLKKKVKIDITVKETKRIAELKSKTDGMEYLLISIKDNGSGISKKNINNIFERGFTTKVKKRESGIGLSVVKEIIEASSGYIFVKSQLGKGTEFKIYLPLVKNKEAEFDPNKKTILLADDELSLLELMSDLFESYDYNVLKATDGKQLINKAKDNVIDLYIIDKKMPKVDGLKCVEKIRKKNGKAKIIMITGSVDSKFENKNRHAFDEIIYKPFDFNQLLSLVEKLIV
ncbi:MAG: response regulator [Melioribacteraceae bacterium]|nr:response regulator [Melioribacteraceae bacterium]MCF8356109.1 response regulator [Melioribacteraceae bacterium]MCF8395593.1 response regulator [Melioribacteraceae bacterium]MCF8419695.1 response regulator [Melioribacteraceae bacterium]